MKILFSVIFFSTFLLSCQKELVVPTQVVEKTLLNVSYGTDSLQRMDVYLPANRNTGSTKLLILIHGGAWLEGDKTDFDSSLIVFKQRLPDYAIINMNYRLAALPARNTFPTQETDIKAAVDFTLARSEEYGFNKNKMAILGGSAGAHLALLHGYKNSSPGFKAVVDLFGPNNMVSFYDSSTGIIKTVIAALFSGTPATNPALYQSQSPINFVNAQSPPTLILHGDADPLVPISQSIALKAKLDNLSVASKLVIYPNEGHGWSGANLLDTYNQIEIFLKEKNP